MTIFMCSDCESIRTKSEIKIQSNQIVCPVCLSPMRLADSEVSTVSDTTLVADTVSSQSDLNLTTFRAHESQDTVLLACYSAIESDPLNVTAYQDIIMRYMSLGQYLQAQRYLARLEAIDANCDVTKRLHTLFYSDETQDQWFVKVCQTVDDALSCEQYPRAFQALKQCLKLKPDALDTLRRSASYFQAVEDHKMALKYLKKIQKQTPKDVHLYINFTVAFYESGDFQRARKALKKATFLDTNHAFQDTIDALKAQLDGAD